VTDQTADLIERAEYAGEAAGWGTLIRALAAALAAEKERADTAEHGRDLARLDTENERRLLRVAGAQVVAEKERADERGAENTILRGLAAKTEPCHYCGAETIIKCPRGFPGCALADDILVAEEEATKRWGERIATAEAQVAALREALWQIAHNDCDDDAPPDGAFEEWARRFAAEALVEHKSAGGSRESGSCHDTEGGGPGLSVVRTVTPGRTLSDIQSSGAAWVTETELAWLCEQVAALREALEYIAGHDVAGYDAHMRPEDVAREALARSEETP